MKGGTSITASLTARDGELLGLEVTFTREFLKDQGEALVRLRRSLDESAVEAGVRIRW